MTYIDSANRKIREPIDYLIEASKRSRKLGMALHLSGRDDLASGADALNANIMKALMESGVEEWESEPCTPQ